MIIITVKGMYRKLKNQKKSPLMFQKKKSHRITNKKNKKIVTHFFLAKKLHRTILQ